MATCCAGGAGAAAVALAVSEYAPPPAPVSAALSLVLADCPRAMGTNARMGEGGGACTAGESAPEPAARQAPARCLVLL